MNKYIINIMLFLGILVYNETAFSQSYYYGGIEIGSKGIKSFLWELKRNKESWEVETLHKETYNLNIISSLSPSNLSYSKEIISDATKSAKMILERIRKKAQDRGEIQVKYFIVISSGAAIANNRVELKDSLVETTNIDVDLISPEDEAEFGMLAVVPPLDRGNSIFVDIGSGNTKIGYWDESSSRYIATSLNYGSVTLREMARSQPGNYRDNLQSIFKTQIEPSYANIVENRPAFKHRSKIYWIGGAAWATNTFTHPESLNKYRSELKIDDIDNFIYLVGSNKWLDYNGAKIVQADKEKALLEMSRVRDVFSESDLLAGVGLMKVILKSSNKKAKIYFPVQNSQWLIGYVFKRYLRNP